VNTPALQLFLELRRLGDVIVLDQRGTGLSLPRLDCPGSIRFPFEVAIERGSAIESLETAARACAQRWRAEGVDLSAYNVAESAEDIEDLRLALGAEKLRLLAGSWGTHLALAAIRAHANVLERAALLGVVGPDHLYGSPADVEAQLVEILRLAKRDGAVTKAFPDLLEAVREAIERLRRAADRRAGDAGRRKPANSRQRVRAGLVHAKPAHFPETISHLPALLAALKEIARTRGRRGWRFAPARPRPCSPALFVRRLRRAWFKLIASRKARCSAKPRVTPRSGFAGPSACRRCPSPSAPPSCPNCPSSS
jgi:pimeloyl-ACP methyl ester carboxylesterase